MSEQSKGQIFRNAEVVSKEEPENLRDH